MRRLTVWGVFAVSVLLVFSTRLEGLTSVISQVFGKDPTLTGRSFLWRQALDGLQEHWLLGLPLGTGVLGANGHVYPHPHSLVAATVFMAGAVGAVALIYLFFRIAVLVGHAPVNGAVSAVVFAAAVALLVGETVNSVQFKALFWGSLAMLSHAPTLDRGDWKMLSPRLRSVGQQPRDGAGRV